ncbi:MAG: hypothetical protein GX254_03910 [Clostridiales bacterium]|jgi:hypothetical protein|nr:hypothetical protein [Clostridiales bacterium]
MSTQFEKLANEFLSSSKGSRLQNKADEIKKIATSSDGQKVREMMGNTEELKTAMEKGDTETLQKVIKKVMSTEEGARLARQLSELLK